jgi:hypothetical protein
MRCQKTERQQTEKSFFPISFDFCYRSARSTLLLKRLNVAVRLLLLLLWKLLLLLLLLFNLNMVGLKERLGDFSVAVFPLAGSLLLMNHGSTKYIAGKNG